MDYDFTDHASTAKPMQGALTPLNSVPDFFLGSESINRTAIEGEVLPPTTVDDEDIYSEEEGEISTDDGDSRAGDWEPNMEYGDTLVMDNDHYKESWEVFTAHETATSVQYKRQADTSNLGYDDVLDPHASKRIKIGENTKFESSLKDENVDWSELPNYIPNDDYPAVETFASQVPDSDLRRRRSRQMSAWIGLATALASAREQLAGGDLELFESLIKRPARRTNPMKKIDRWARSNFGAKTRKQDQVKTKTKDTAKLAEDVDASPSRMAGMDHELEALNFL